MTTPADTAAPPAADTSGPVSDAAESSVSISPVQTADTQAPASTPGDNTASPPDAPVDERAGLLEAVRKVVEVAPKTPQQGEGSAAAPEGSPTPDPNAQAAQTAADALEADPTDAELGALVPKTKARVEKLLSQRNAARTEAETLKPDAAKWQQMHGYLSKNDLAAEDVNLLLGVGAALRRGDFKAFLDGVGPYVQLANEHLGNTLPPDLQTKVDGGEITAEAARELSTTRLANARLQGTVQANTRAAQVAAQDEANTRTAQAVTQAVTTWEHSVKARDPDYARKAPTVLRVSQALMAEHGRPTTTEAAVELARRAYEETNRMFAGMAPAPVPTRPSPSGVSTVNGARPEPKTLMEAAMLGLERSRR